MRVAALVLAAVALVTANTVTAERSSIVTCESIIYPEGSFRWRPKRVVLGVVAVPPVYTPYAPESDRNDRIWPYGTKAGLVIRAGSPRVVVSVPRLGRGRAAIAWGNEGPTSALRFDTCPPASSLGDWNPYAGGFFLRLHAACVPLTFTVAGRSATVRFGIGKHCA
jgi:hypothetical protein